MRCEERPMYNQPQRQDVSPQLSFKGVWHIASASPIMSIVADSAVTWSRQRVQARMSRSGAWAAA